MLHYVGAGVCLVLAVVTVVRARRLTPFVALESRRLECAHGDRARHARGADSEVGPLQTVMLHRPGPELKRLTPRNNDRLLFDGIPWVARAQDEHDAFAEALRDRDVEVLYLTDLLTETLRRRGAPATEAIETALSQLHLGDTMRRYLRPLLTESSPEQLTTYLTAGIRNDEVRGGFGLVTSLLPQPRLPDRPAAQPAVHPRLQRLDPRPGGHHVAGDAGPPPRDPADRADLHPPPALRRHRHAARLARRARRGRRRAAARARRRRRRRRRADDARRRRAARPRDHAQGPGAHRARRADRPGAGDHAPRHRAARWSTSTRS